MVNPSSSLSSMCIFVLKNNILNIENTIMRLKIDRKHLFEITGIIGNQYYLSTVEELKSVANRLKALLDRMEEERTLG